MTIVKKEEKLEFKFERFYKTFSHIFFSFSQTMYIFPSCCFKGKKTLAHHIKKKKNYIFKKGRKDHTIKTPSCRIH